MEIIYRCYCELYWTNLMPACPNYIYLLSIVTLLVSLSQNLLEQGVVTYKYTTCKKYWQWDYM